MNDPTVIDTIILLINSVGFPIVVCIALFWMVRDILSKVLESMQQFTIAMTKNTDSINTLIKKIGDLQ